MAELSDLNTLAKHSLELGTNITIIETTNITEENYDQKVSKITKYQ